MESEGIMVTPTLRYFAPGHVQPGVVWCAEVPGREAVWSRQLCAALRLSRRESKGKRKAPIQHQLTLFGDTFAA